MSMFTHNNLRYNTYRQVFQLQLTDCVVRFDVFRDEAKLEIGVIKDSIPLLSVRPILGTFYLKTVHIQRGSKERKAVRLLEQKQDILRLSD